MMKHRKNPFHQSQNSQNDSINFEDIIEEKMIGKGTLGAVFKVTSGDKVYAVKRISKSLLKKLYRKEQFERQIEILKKIEHPNIVSFYELAQTSQFYQIKMEFIEGTNLRKFLLKSQSMTIKQKRKFATKVSLEYICTISALRSFHVVNRDIKPENIMVNCLPNGQVTVKMIDLGECAYMSNNMDSYHGTPGYMAPQIFQNKPYNDLVDIWSLGVTLYQIFMGNHPQKKGILDLPYLKNSWISQSQYYNKDIKEGLILSKSLIPDPIRTIIRQMLRENPQQRITFLQILTILYQQVSQLQDSFTHDEIRQFKSLIFSCLISEKKSLQKKNQNEQLRTKLRQLYKNVFIPLQYKQYKQKKINSTILKQVLILLKLVIEKLYIILEEIQCLQFGNTSQRGLHHDEIKLIGNLRIQVQNLLSIKGIHEIPSFTNICPKLRGYLMTYFRERDQEMIQCINEQILE